MLSQAVRVYIRRFGVLPGQRVVVATNNDDAYATADAVADAGGEVVAILDSRPQWSEAATAAKSRFQVFIDARPVGTKGNSHHLKRVEATIRTERRRFEADLLALSGGFTPAVHLHSQAGGALDWRGDVQAFVPGASRRP